MLSIKFKESIILFDNKYYGQVDGGGYGFIPQSNLSNYFSVSLQNELV